MMMSAVYQLANGAEYYYENATGTRLLDSTISVMDMHTIQM